MNPLSKLLQSNVEPTPIGRHLGLIRPKQIARYFGCSTRTIDREIERGHLVTIKVAGRSYVTRAAVLDWWDRSQTRPCRARAADSMSAADAKPRTESASPAVPSRLRQTAAR